MWGGVGARQLAAGSRSARVLQGTVANKFYVHNDVFRYQDEVFVDSDSEPPEGEIFLLRPAEPETPPPPPTAPPTLKTPPSVLQSPRTRWRRSRSRFHPPMSPPRSLLPSTTPCPGGCHDPHAPHTGGGGGGAAGPRALWVRSSGFEGDQVKHICR